MQNSHYCAEWLWVPAGDGNVNGFGLEFYIETPGSEIAETIHDVKKSWQFQLLYTVSQLAAGKPSSEQNKGIIQPSKRSASLLSAPAVTLC